METGTPGQNPWSGKRTWSSRSTIPIGRRTQPLNLKEVFELLRTYGQGGPEAAALHVPLVNAVCHAIASTLNPVPNRIDCTTGLERGRFAPERFLAPSLAGLQAPVPVP